MEIILLQDEPAEFFFNASLNLSVLMSVVAQYFSVSSLE